MTNQVRKYITLLFCLVFVVLLASCSKSAKNSDEESPLRPIPLIETDDTQDAPVQQDFLKVLSGVETDQKVVSFVFEGWTDDADMTELIQLLSTHNVPAWFLISGIIADEHPEFVQLVNASGFGIANDGVSPKGMAEAKNASDVCYQYEKTNSILQTASVSVLPYGGLNGIACSNTVLLGAEQAKLDGVLKGSVYLNHHSFGSVDDANFFTNTIIRGNLIVVKLGQELSDEEFGDSEVMWDEKPAIDLEPGIDKGSLETVARDQHTSAEPVSWLLDALENSGYAFVSPLDLQEYEIELLPKVAELTDDFLALCDFSRYYIPVTDKPLEASALYVGDFSALGRTVLVGDSIVEGLNASTQWHQKSNPDFFSDVSFLTANSVSIEQLLEEPLFLSRKADSDQSAKLFLEDALAELQPDRIYLMVHPAISKAYSSKNYLANYRLLLYRIKNKNPDTQIVIQSVLPKPASNLTNPTNQQIFRYNLLLFSMCKEYGIPFVDTAFAMRDEKGNLREEYSLSAAADVNLLNDAGCTAWLEYLCNNIPE